MHNAGGVRDPLSRGLPMYSESWRQVFWLGPWGAAPSRQVIASGLMVLLIARGDGRHSSGYCPEFASGSLLSAWAGSTAITGAPCSFRAAKLLFFSETGKYFFRFVAYFVAARRVRKACTGLPTRCQLSRLAATVADSAMAKADTTPSPGTPKYTHSCSSGKWNRYMS